MRAVRLACLIILASALTGCVTTPPVTLTPLEIQSLQTRDYENVKTVVYPSVLSVFQDIGYTITNADIETGIISGESATSSSSATQFFLGYTSTRQTRATAFVEQIGSIVKVRLNFVEVQQTSTGSGQSNRADTPILSAEVYQNAFEQIESAIFVRSSTQ